MQHTGKAWTRCVASVPTPFDEFTFLAFNVSSSMMVKATGQNSVLLGTFLSPNSLFLQLYQPLKNTSNSIRSPASGQHRLPIPYLTVMLGPYKPISKSKTLRWNMTVFTIWCQILRFFFSLLNYFKSIIEIFLMVWHYQTFGTWWSPNWPWRCVLFICTQGKKLEKLRTVNHMEFNLDIFT